MPVLAATATTSAIDVGLFLLILTAVTLGYGLACWLWPFTPCRRCRGTGVRRALFGGAAFGLCRRCDGTGRQLRAGRRIANHLRELHRQANR